MLSLSVFNMTDILATSAQSPAVVALGKLDFLKGVMWVAWVVVIIAVIALVLLQKGQSGIGGLFGGGSADALFSVKTAGKIKKLTAIVGIIMFLLGCAFALVIKEEESAVPNTGPEDAIEQPADDGSVDDGETDDGSVDGEETNGGPGENGGEDGTDKEADGEGAPEEGDADSEAPDTPDEEAPGDPGAE